MFALLCPKELSGHLVLGSPVGLSICNSKLSVYIKYMQCLTRIASGALPMLCKHFRVKSMPNDMNLHGNLVHHVE